MIRYIAAYGIGFLIAAALWMLVQILAAVWNIQNQLADLEEKNRKDKP